MQKMQELLLVLSNEERDEAEEFINRKLKLLDADQLADLEDTASSGQTTLEEIRQESIQIDGASRTGKMMTRIYNSALEGFARLVRYCNLVASQKKREVSESDSKSEASAGGASTLIIETEPEDEVHTWSVIESSLAEMTPADIRELRDACEEILSWWQTEGGMQKSLHINQWNEVNTANGRLAIRKAREDFQAEEIAPSLGFYQTVNLIYQKKNQEVKRIQRQERLREKAGLL